MNGNKSNLNSIDNILSTQSLSTRQLTNQSNSHTKANSKHYLTLEISSIKHFDAFSTFKANSITNDSTLDAKNAKRPKLSSSGTSSTLLNNSQKVIFKKAYN